MLKTARAAFKMRQEHGTIKRSTFAACGRFAGMDLMTLTEIRGAASRTGGNAISARVHVQVESAAPRLTREQQPYCKLALADACDRMTLRVWSDHPAYKTCSALSAESFIELSGEFHHHHQ